MSTIENIDGAIINSVNSLLTIVNGYLSISVLDSIDIDKCNELVEEIKNVDETYKLMSIQYLTGDCKTHYEDYVKFVNKNNFIRRLDRVKNILSIIKNRYNVNSKAQKSAWRLLDKITVDILIQPEKNTEICSCGGTFVIDQKNHEFVCNKCRKVGENSISSAITEEVTEKKVKKTHHDPLKHFEFWMSCIEGKEPKDNLETVLRGIKTILIQDEVLLDNITYSMIRSYLKILGYTEYYNYVVYIKSKLTGLEPEPFSNSERDMIKSLFAMHENAYNNLKSNLKKKNMYYPYIIYKLICHSIQNKARRKNFLNRIHLQAQDTIIANDMIWKEMCASVGHVKYVATTQHIEDD